MNGNLKISVPELEGQIRFDSQRGGVRSGAGRKAIGETKKISLTLSNDTWSYIRSRCDRNSLSQSEVIRELLEACIKIEDDE